MWHKLFLFSIGVILVITITFGVRVSIIAQGDYKNLTRVQMDDWCTKYAPDHNDPPKRGIQLDSSQQNVNGWGCLDYDNRLHGITISDMCRFYYGDSYADAKYGDYNNPDSWYCNRVNTPAQQPANNPPSGGSSGGGSGVNPNPQQQPQPQGGPLHPDMQEPGGPGVKVPIGCGYAGHGWGTNENQANAYDWKCADGYQLGPSDFQQFCQEAWGSQYPYVTLANWRNKYGWQCSSQPGYIDPYPGQGSTGNSGGGQQPSGTNECPSSPSRLTPGDEAWVSDADPYDLKVFTAPSLDAQRLQGIPIRETVTMGQGPTCIGGRIWWTISYQGRTGWAIEVNHNNTYNLIPGVWGGNSGSRLCTASAVPRYLGNPKTSVPYIKDQFVLRVDLSGQYFNAIRRVDYKGVPTNGVDIHKWLSAPSDPYIDLWIHSSWGWPNLGKYVVEGGMYFPKEDWVVWYAC